MTAEVEQRIVEMRFDNEQFEKGAKQTLSTLEKLDGILDMLGSGGMDHLTSALDAMEYRFSRLGIAGAAAIEKITGKVMTLAANVLTAIPQQIMSGGEARAMNIEQARFQLKGLGVEWDELSQSIDYAVMGTAYGVDEAAKIASILVASKVDFKNAADGATDLGKALRGISGIAGMTNSSFEEIGNLMGDIFAMGKLSTRQLQSFELRGLNVAAKLAEMSQNGQLKHLGDDAKYTEEQIRDLVSKGKIDALTFAKAMDAAFGEHATKANETYTGALRNLKASLSRIGEPFFTAWHEGLRKIFLEARQTFDRVKKIVKPFAEGKFSETINHISDRVVDLLNKLDLDWLNRIVKFLDKSDALVKPFDWLIDRLNDLNEISRRLFGGGMGREGIYDRFEWVFVIKKNLADLIPTLKKFRDTAYKILNNLPLGMMAQNVVLLISNLVKDALPYLNRFLDWLGVSSDSFRDFLHDLTINAVMTVYGVEQVFGGLVRVGISLFNLLSAIFGKIFPNFGKNKNELEGYIPTMWKISDAITEALDKLSAWIDKLTELIDKGPSAESSLGKIGHGFELVGNFVGGVVNAISAFLRYILGIREGETIFSRFGRMFKTVGESVRTVFGNIRESIQGTFGEGGVGKEAIKIATALYTVLIGYRKIESKKFAFGRFSKAFEFLKDLLTKSYESIRAINPLQWADDIETLLRRTSSALRAFADNLNAKSLLTIAGAVVALSFGLTMLAAVAEGDHLTGALVALTLTMGLLIGAMAALKAITDQGLFKNVTKGWKGFIDIFKNSISKYLNAITLKETVTALLLFTAAVGVLALAVIGLGFAFKSLSLRDIALAVATVGALMVLLTGMLVWINKASKGVGMLDSTKFIAIAAAFVGMALAVDLLALAVAGLTAVFNGSNVWAAIGAVGTIIVLLGALVGAMALLNIWTKEIGGFKLLLIATAMIGMALAVDLLALAVVGLSYAFQGLESAWPVIGAVVAIGAMLVAMAGTLAFLSSMLETVSVVKILAVSAALVLMSGAILVVAAAAIGFAAAMQMSEKWWHVLAAMVGTLVAMAAVLGVLSLLGPKILIAAGAILAVGFAIKIACEGFVKLSESMVVLAGALNMLPADGSLETLGKGMGKVAGGLAKIAAAGLIFPNNLADKFEALVPLASAMTLMSDIDFAPLADKEHGMPAAAKAIKSFGGLFGVGMSMLWGSSGLIAAGHGLLSLGEGLRNLAPGMQAFSAVENPEAVANTLKELAFAVTTLDANSTFGNRDYLPQLAENLTKIANAISGLSADQVQAIRNLGAALSDAFTENSGQAAAALQTELTLLQQTLETGSEQFIIVARRFPMHIQSGIKDNTVVAENAMKKLIWDMCAVANSDEVKNNLRIIGGNIAKGIANGITSRTQEAANAMRRLASALQTSFTVSLQIRSPSRVFENLAEYIPQGIARGIQNGETGITDSMASSMNGAMNLLDQYSRNSDFSPTVTPVMDMANMRRDIRYADRMFAGSPMSSFNGLNGLTVSGDAISYNMQNRDVVNEIRNMTDRVNRLGEAIQSMQMVLDSGVLVGQIGQKMNRELGTIAIRERRQ